MEYLPMALLETKSYKLQIVAFDIQTDSCEIVDDNANRFFVKPYDITNMADKICMLIENKELRQRFFTILML